MKKLIVSSILSLAASSAMAAPFAYNVTNDVYSGIVNGIPTANDHNDGSPDLYQAVNHLIGTSYTANSDIDDRFVEPDSFYFGNGKHSVALIGLTAGNQNTLGVYDDLGTGANKQSVLGPISGFGIPHQGTAADPYLAGTFDITGAFGWYLDSQSGSGTTTFYSEGGLNADGYDHMMSFKMDELNGQTVYINSGSGSQAYTFQNTFLLGWEDLYINGSSDNDYDDMIYLVDFRPVVDVIEPSSLALAGLGLMLIGGSRRRKQA